MILHTNYQLEIIDMKVNDYEITQKFFAYDGCHKIYLIDDEDLVAAEKTDYQIVPIEYLPNVWRASCELRFIRTWKLESIVGQYEDAVFEH